MPRPVSNRVNGSTRSFGEAQWGTESNVADGTERLQGTDGAMRETDSNRMPRMALIAHDPEMGSVVVDGLDSFAELIELRSLSDLETQIASDQTAYEAVILTKSEADSACINSLSGLIGRSNLPVVIFAEQDPERLAPLAIRSGISSFVVDGLDVGRVRPIVEIALERFRMIRALQTELEKSQERLAARKIVEQAKGLLMQHRSMTEQEAYKTLRDMAMRQGKPLKVIAENIIAMSDLLP